MIPTDISVDITEALTNPAAISQYLVCTECGKTYTSRKYLHSHMWYAHKISTADNPNAETDADAAETAELEDFLTSTSHSVVESTSVMPVSKVNRTNTKTPPIKCMYCISRFSHLQELVSHMSSKHAHSRYYVCCLCLSQFRHNPTLVNHFVQAHKIKTNYNTLKLLKVVLTPLTKENHPLAVASVNHRYYCPCCQQVFKHCSELENDIRTHLEMVGESGKACDPQRELFECHECGELFKSMKYLDEHCNMIHFHRYVCKHCARHFPSTTHLSSHLKIHSDEKNWTCETCGRKFRHASSLRSHRLIHSDVLKYMCSHCGKKFRFSQGLRYHMNAYHNQDFMNRFTCEQCDYSTGQRSALVIHRRKHTGERPYKCNVCNKAFMQKKHCKRHESIHEKEQRALPPSTTTMPTTLQPHMMALPQQQIVMASQTDMTLATTLDMSSYRTSW